MSAAEKQVALDVKNVARALRVQPRVVFLSDAPRYLGMSAIQFRVDVRPKLNEAKMGSRIVFDREELDEWWSDYMATHGKRGKKPTDDEMKRWRGNAEEIETLASRRKQTASGTSTASTKESAYARARERAVSRTRKST